MDSEKVQYMFCVVTSVLAIILLFACPMWFLWWFFLVGASAKGLINFIALACQD